MSEKKVKSKMLLLFSICIYFGIVYGQLDIVTDETPLAERGACISNPCLHNGMCIITSSGFICTCVNGYIGVNCERRADDCSRDLSMKCINGVCKLDMNGHPKCVCAEGYEGPICELQIDNCATNPCLNSGTCIDKIGGYECKCPAETSGSHCQIKNEDTRKCLATCGEYYFDGKCWKDEGSKVVASWGLGEENCNSKQTCYNATKGKFNDNEFVPLQLKPIQMQDNDDLIFITDRDAKLYDYHFIPHILPMEANSDVAFLSCNTTNALPLAKNKSISKLDVNETLLHPGTQYFIADTNALYRCDFGLRLNVTVKEKKCTDPSSLNTNQICNGRGKCFTDFTKKDFECLCCPGYAGQYCQHEDPCIAKPCVNGGQCNILELGSGQINHECICPSGYHGKQCEQLINHCQSYPCKNDGACYPELGNFRCQCKDGFSGKQCEVNDDECASSPCKNDAECEDGLNNFKCVCQPGYKGTLCEVNIDDCETQPCINSTCLDLVNNYTCACSPGQSGRNCEEVLDGCLSQPCVNGKCVKEKNEDFSCSCGIGYTGQLCELKLNLCSHSQYCITSHAVSCVDTGDNVTCACADGWAGSNCGVNIDECAKHKCLNGAKCIDGKNGYSCKCRKSFTGLYCEVPPTRVVPDIEIEFMADDCRKFQNPLGVRHLEENILALLRSACKCSLTSSDLQPESSKVVCKDEMAGTFQFDLSTEYRDVSKRKQIICSMKNKIQSENTPTIYHNTYIVDTKDDEELCGKGEEVNLQASELSSSKTGVVIGVVVILSIIVVALVFVVYKLKISRNIRIGVAHKFIRETSFDNAAYFNDVSKDNSLDETSFMSHDQSRDQLEENIMECPRWANSYDRARKLYDRNRSNVPAGRLFDIHQPGGESSKL